MKRDFELNKALLGIILLSAIMMCFAPSKSDIQKAMVEEDVIEEVVPEIIIIETEVVEKNYLDVCSTSSVKSYMSYKAITNQSSKQWQYIHTNMVVNEKGLLETTDGYIGVALGSYFGEIGNKYIITLSTGIELKVVKVDEKSDRHTNNGCEQKYDKSVIEFVIDTEQATKYFGKMSNDYVLNGNFNNSNFFKGKIESIEVVE